MYDGMVFERKPGDLLEMSSLPATIIITSRHAQIGPFKDFFQSLTRNFHCSFRVSCKHRIGPRFDQPMTYAPVNLDP